MADRIIAQFCNEMDGFRRAGQEGMRVSLTIKTTNEEQRQRIERTLKTALEAEGCSVVEIPLI